MKLAYEDRKPVMNTPRELTVSQATAPITDVPCEVRFAMESTQDT